jgi:ATP-dependent Clp protease ATP-binding subunit ClpA
VFERFTERARQVVVLAQDEARALSHNYIGTEHILLGLLREEEGIAARVLGELGVTLEAIRSQVAQIVGRGDEVTSGQIPFTPRAKKVLELGLREARRLGHNWIGTEHILLGLRARPKALQRASCSTSASRASESPRACFTCSEASPSPARAVGTSPRRRSVPRSSPSRSGSGS